MGFHHLALATRDIKATHEFYTAAMGFDLVKVAVGPAGKRGFAKHLFYDTGNGELIAFWDLHDPDLTEDWSPAIATPRLRLDEPRRVRAADRASRPPLGALVAHGAM
jgi:catechol 2,3-dioxygenase-like lactoylglutathione lyase family enzyme